MKNPKNAALFVSLSVVLWVFFSFLINLEYRLAFVGGGLIFLLGILAVLTGFYATVIAIHVGVWAALLPMFFMLKSCTEAAACAFAGISYFLMFASASLMILIVGICLDILKLVTRSIDKKITGEHQ